MEDNPKRSLQAGPEQLAYAGVLEKGMLFGMILLLVTYFIYVVGIFKSYIPLAEIPQCWSMNVHDYLNHCKIETGWSWVNMVGLRGFPQLYGDCFTGRGYNYLLSVHRTRAFEARGQAICFFRRFGSSDSRSCGKRHIGIRRSLEKAVRSAHDRGRKVHAHKYEGQRPNGAHRRLRCDHGRQDTGRGRSYFEAALLRGRMGEMHRGRPSEQSWCWMRPGVWWEFWILRASWRS